MENATTTTTIKPKKTRAEREKSFAEKRKSLALSLALSYHKRVSALHQSKHASTEYGIGGRECTDWDLYSKAWHRRYGPANYRNSGARIVGYAQSARVVLENYRGTEVARLPLPPKDAIFSFVILLDGDLFATSRTIGGCTVYTRWMYNKKNDGYTRSGYAVVFRIPNSILPYWRNGWNYGNVQGMYVEHGKTVHECREQFENKITLVQRQLDERKLRAFNARKVHLIGLLCKRLIVKRSDSIIAGNCRAGTDAFVQRFFPSGGTYTTVGELKRIVGSDYANKHRVQMVIDNVAGKLSSRRRIHLPVIV